MKNTQEGLGLGLVNERPYDVLNTHTFYDPAMIDDWSYQFNAGSINQDTALGMSNLHENRVIGKAAYKFGFQPYSHSLKKLFNRN